MFAVAARKIPIEETVLTLAAVDNELVCRKHARADNEPAELSIPEVSFSLVTTADDGFEYGRCTQSADDLVFDGFGHIKPACSPAMPTTLPVPYPSL